MMMMMMISMVITSSKGPLMVMCGDGSGRTGTLIAIYKLWLDLEDSDCGSLALLPTGKWGNQSCGIFIQISFGLEEAKKRTGSKLWSIHDHCSMSQVTNIMLDVD